jgi:hypothetical protein
MIVSLLIGADLARFLLRFGLAGEALEQVETCQATY